MGAAPHTALPGTLFSTDLRAFYAGSLGLSVFLLVSIRLGDRRLSIAGNRVSQDEKLKRRSAGRVFRHAVPAALGEKMQRAGSITDALHKGGFVLRIGRAKLITAELSGQLLLKP
jgi:hypothetical protein